MSRLEGRATSLRRAGRWVRTLAVLACVSVLTVAGCSGSNDGNGAQKADGEALLVERNLDGLDTRQVIERLDSMAVDRRPTDLIASIRPSTLLITDDRDREVELPLPADEVYVSVAPYRDQTHECHFHSLTTCLGELRNAEIGVRLVGEDGAVILDERRTTFDNGFVGLWVPRGIEATLTIDRAGRQATTKVSTRADDDPTCVTTMRLS